MQQINYTITQDKMVLTSSEKIVINKYTNKIIVLNFILDDLLEGARVYFALLNPVTKKYKTYPLSVDNTITLSTDVSKYQGTWKGILLATDEDYEIIDEDIDQTKCIYVSNESKFIIVKDNFLDDETDETLDEKETNVIKQLLDETVAMRDLLKEYADESNQACITTTEKAEQVNQMLTEIIDNVNINKEYLTKIKAWVDGDENITETVNNNGKYYYQKNQEIENVILNKVKETDSNLQKCMQSEEDAEKAYQNSLKMYNEIVSQKEEIENNIQNMNKDVAKIKSNQENIISNIDQLQKNESNIMQQLEVINEKLGL